MIIADINDSRFIFKYRPINRIIEKELIYGEMYLAEATELNDPYDTRLCYRFGREKERYQRLVEFCIRENHLEVPRFDIDVISDYLAKECNTFEELLARTKSVIFKTIVLKAISGTNELERLGFAEYFIFAFQQMLYSVVEKFAYVCSFSKKPDSPIMWSHYADQHRGICLIFDVCNGLIQQNPMKRKAMTILLDGKKIFSEDLIKYKVEEVEYQDTVESIDGFLCFGESVYGESLSKEKVNDFWEKWKKSARTKFTDWKYEEEVRIIEYDEGFSSRINEDGKNGRFSEDRIFYYDQTQLVGIIMGAAISKNNKETIKRIILKMRSELANETGSLLPPFIFANSSENMESYKMKINVENVYNINNKLIPPMDYDKEIDKLRKLSSMMKNSINNDQLKYHIYNINK